MKPRIQYTWIGSRWGVFFTSITTLWFGIFLGCWQLAMREVSVVEIAPREEKPHKVVFVRGSSELGMAWQGKLNEMLGGRARQIVLTEGDFNLFLSNTLSAGQEKSTIIPSVRIREGFFYIGVMSTPPGRKYPICFQSKGLLQRASDGVFSFEPKRTYLGTLPLPDFLARPIISAALKKMFGSPSSEKLSRSWKLLKGLRIDENVMRLTW